jgi:hypothetical protein
VNAEQDLLNKVVHIVHRRATREERSQGRREPRAHVDERLATS